MLTILHYVDRNALAVVSPVFRFGLTGGGHLYVCQIVVGLDYLITLIAENKLLKALISIIISNRKNLEYISD